MSQRNHIKFLFNQIPASDLRGANHEDLVSKCVAYYDAVQSWGKKGNTKIVNKAGSGLSAICAWRAAKILARDAQIEPFQKLSGLSPRQFNACDFDLDPAFPIRAHDYQPMTPRRNEKRTVASSPAQISSRLTKPATPQSRLNVTNATVSEGNGVAMSSPLSRLGTGQSVRFLNEPESNVEDPRTPTRRAGRVESLMKEKQIQDSSSNDLTPTRTSTSNKTPTSAASSIQARKRISEAIENITASPSSHIKRARKTRRINLDSPLGEPSRVGGVESYSEWESKNSNEKIQKCIAALQDGIDRKIWVGQKADGFIKLSF